MFKWMKKLHMYAGLLTFSAFVVWGVTGIHGAFTPAPGEGGPPEISATQEIRLEAPGNLDDAALARYVYDHLDIPLRGGHYNIHRDDRANLSFFVFTANGRRDVTYLEERKMVRLEIRQNGLTPFLSTMHTAHSRRGPTTPAARAWGFYNEFSTWAFLFMTISGVYLWLATRPGLRWAQLIAAVTLSSAAILWLATR
jgi:hypothetical protein